MVAYKKTIILLNSTWLIFSQYALGWIYPTSLDTGGRLKFQMHHSNIRCTTEGFGKDLSGSPIAETLAGASIESLHSSLNSFFGYFAKAGTLGKSCRNRLL